MVEVVDASVGIKWFIMEDGRTAALRVLERILSQPALFCVPELFYFELIHVFNRLIPKPSQEQIALLDIIFVLGVKRFSLTPELASEIRVFQGLGLSGYDSAYLAVAKLTRGNWLTFDAQAHKKVAHLRLSTLVK